MTHAAGTLLLSRSRIATLAGSRDYLSAMRDAFVTQAHAGYRLPPVAHIGCSNGAFHLKSAQHTTEPALVALKVNGNFAQNPALHGLPTIQGFIALLDGATGRVLALMDSVEITARRTAAATALAAVHLARSDSAVLALIGCGMQARYHLDALIDVLPIGQVRICDPRDSAASLLEREIAARRIGCERVAHARDAARGADVVVTLTPSSQPILTATDVAAGTFVAGVGADNPGKHELAPDLLRGSRVVVDLVAQAAAMGDLHHAIDAGAMIVADIHAELSDIVVGRIAGRTTPDERFVFDSTGVALQDLAAATMIYERALAAPGVSRITLDDLRAPEPPAA